MIKHLHSGWAYLALLILIVAFVNALRGLSSKKEFRAKDLRLSLFTLIIMHIQLILGFVMYYMSPYYAHMKEVGMGATMKDATARLFVVEHPLMMIIAIVLITMGFSKHKKKTTDKARFKTIAIFYGLALLLVLLRIPWQTWFTS